MRQFEECAESDAIVVGAGPSGLTAARELARQGWRVLVVERDNYLGGGFWIGGYLMNEVTLRAPAQRVLAELGVPYQEAKAGLSVADGPHATSKLIASACDAGVKFANMTIFDDVVVRKADWRRGRQLDLCISCTQRDIVLEARVDIDCTGHAACVARKLEERGLVKTVGFGAMSRLLV